MSLRNGDLDAVHIDDLEILLKRMGIAEQFSKSEVKCKFCKTIMTPENIYSILPQSGQVHLVCNKPVCITALLEVVADKQGKQKET